MAARGGLALLCTLFLALQFLALQDATALPRAPADFPHSSQQTWQAWQTTMRQAQHAATPRQLEAINNFFNRRIRYVEDQQLWGQEDYWASPMQTMRKRAGDCEDFAIAKYASLRELGVPAERLRLIYVRARMGRPGSGMSRAHMVLGYYASATADPLILDSLVPAILPGSQRDDLKPIFSFNGEGLWAGDSTQSRANPVARLSRWREVLQRMRAEGFTADN